MSLRSRLGMVRSGVLHRCYRRLITLEARRPIISFTFDDFPRTAYTAGGSILEAFGAHGTYYAAAGLMNTSGELGAHFTRADLSALLDKGHELANHTFGHISGRSVSCRQFAADIERGKQTLEAWTGQSITNFSYPFGHVTLQTKKVLAHTVSSARGIHQGVNGPDVDLNLLFANRIYGGLDHAATLNALIEENVRRKGWLIFYTHDIRPEPSPYGCTPTLFQSVVSAAAREGNEILPIGQALITLGASPALPYDVEAVAPN